MLLDISFAILTWNSETYIANCLNSVFADLNNTPYSYEIFTVDNGSKDGTIQIIEAFMDKYPEYIIRINLERNMGTTYSRNLALKRAKGKFIVLLDSDVEVSPGTTEHLINTLKNNKEVGIVAPRLLYPNGKLQKSTDVFPTIFTKIIRYFFLKVIERRQEVLGKDKELTEVDYAISAVWMLRSDVLQKVGLLDESFFYAPEDVDYCLRMWKAGYKVAYITDVSCIHHTQEISRGLKVNRATYEHIRGLAYYFRKHKYLFRRPRFAGQVG